MAEITDTQRSLNRLRAAAGLIPIIEAGLSDGKLASEKAALMCEFCTWAVGHGNDLGDEGEKLISTLEAGLSRLKATMAN